ncbi:hypothetical protein AKJ16_DCAP03709 [Drosera capensis]
MKANHGPNIYESRWITLMHKLFTLKDFLEEQKVCDGLSKKKCIVVISQQLREGEPYLPNMLSPFSWGANRCQEHKKQSSNEIKRA